MQIKADVVHAAHHTYVIDIIIEPHVTHRDTVRLSECNLTLCTKRFAPQNLEQRQSESHIVQRYPFSHWRHSIIYIFIFSQAFRAFVLWWEHSKECYDNGMTHQSMQVWLH